MIMVNLQQQISLPQRRSIYRADEALAISCLKPICAQEYEEVSDSSLEQAFITLKVRE